MLAHPLQQAPASEPSQKAPRRSSPCSLVIPSNDWSTQSNSLVPGRFLWLGTWPILVNRISLISNVFLRKERGSPIRRLISPPLQGLQPRWITISIMTMCILFSRSRQTWLVGGMWWFRPCWLLMTSSGMLLLGLLMKQLMRLLILGRWAMFFSTPWILRTHRIQTQQPKASTWTSNKTKTKQGKNSN